MGVRPRRLDMIASMRREAADRAKRENAADVGSAGMRRLRAAEIRFGRRRSAPQSSVERRGSMFTVRAAAPAAASMRGPSIATPLASIEALCSGLQCTWCGGAAPIPKITGLHRFRRPPSRRAASPKGNDRPAAAFCRHF
jgi:hypothetical protein